MAGLRGADTSAKPMKSTNDKIDEILTILENAVALNVGSRNQRGESPKHSHWKAKLRLTKLIEEETTKARIEELEQPCCKHGETTCARREKRLTELKERENSNE